MRAASGPVLTSSVGGLLFVSALEVFIFAIVFTLGCFASSASRADLLLGRFRWSWLPLGIAYSVALRIVVGLLAALVISLLLKSHLSNAGSVSEFMSSNRPDVERMVDVGAMRNNPTYHWLTITLISFVVAGLREELWRIGTLAALRALWPGLFGSRGGQVAGVIVIALFFGAAHYPMGFFAACLAGLLGLFLGGIMLMHQSIWPAVIAHGFFDATSMALLPYALETIRPLQ